jgi:hypothetical protein
MKQIIESLSKKEKMITAIIVGWTFIHFIFLLISEGNKRVFWPFDNEPMLISDYDKIEFLVYVITPILIFLIYLLLTKSQKTENAIKNGHKPSFDFKNHIISNKSFFLFYFIWVCLQVIFLLISNCTWERGMYYPQLFFPFSGYPSYFYDNEKNPLTLLIYTYSYSEFLVYTLSPLAIKYFILIRNHKKSIKNLSEKNPNESFAYAMENIPEKELLKKQTEPSEFAIDNLHSKSDQLGEILKFEKSLVSPKLIYRIYNVLLWMSLIYFFGCLIAFGGRILISIYNQYIPEQLLIGLTLGVSTLFILMAAVFVYLFKIKKSMKAIMTSGHATNKEIIGIITSNFWRPFILTIIFILLFLYILPYQWI